MVFVATSTLEAQTPISFNRINNLGDDYKDEPDYGHRRPPRKIIGYINWDNHTFILPDDISETALSYELWNDETCISQSSDAEDIISLLSDLHAGPITIIIITKDCKLVGDYVPSD